MLPLRHPASGRGEVPLVGNGPSVGQRDQCQPSLLRTEGQQSLSEEAAADILRQNRPLTDSEHAGLRPRVWQGGDITGREDFRIRRRSQSIIDADEAARIEGETGLAKPGSRPA